MIIHNSCVDIIARQKLIGSRTRWLTVVRRLCLALSNWYLRYSKVRAECFFNIIDIIDITQLISLGAKWTIVTSGMPSHI
jgi:hypothetical protein